MKLRVLFCLSLSIFLAGSVSAATRTFTGVIDELWSNADNWDAIPGVDDKARVHSELPCILDYDAGIIQNYVGEGGNVGHLLLIDGAKLSVRQWTIIGYNGGEVDARHTIEVLDGELNGGHADYPNNGRIHVGRQGYGRLIIDYNGRVNMLHQDLQIGTDNGGDGVVELRGGLLDCGTSRLIASPNANATALVDFSGGVLKQAYSDDRLAEINGWIASGEIIAYDGDGTVLVNQENGDMIVKGLHPLNPTPTDSGSSLPGSIALEWTVDEGTPVDVWFGTKADLSDFEKIVDQQAATTVNVMTVAKQRYFWAVDTYAPGADEPNLGPIFDFQADNQAPSVDAGDDVTTWITDGSVVVALSGTVEDNDVTTTLWTVISEPDDPNSLDAVIADPEALNTTVTLSTPGEYVLQLQADDGEYLGTDTLTINVFSDHCEAAKSLPGWEAIPGDINLDCVVNELDEAIMLENWLNCNGLDCPDPNGL
jgi:hypothetical protein